MKTSTFVKGIPMLPRVGACLVALAGALILGDAGCNEAAQGDRCNPLRSSNECGGGLVCAGNPIGMSAASPIPFCPENYCCPANADGTVDFASATSPYCQPGCNGGAAAICAADNSAPDAEACEVAACLADASDPTTCVPEDGSAPESDAATSDAATSDAASDATVPEAGASEAATPEAATEAATPPSDASADVAEAAPTD
jgi:hypothetical protein